MKKHLYLILISIVIFTSCSSQIEINHHAVNIITFDSTKISPDVKIVPYEINRIAIRLTENFKANLVLKNYIIWFFNHLNYNDKFGLSGTINNYIVNKEGDEEKIIEYTSILGTSATFLILTDLYLKKTRKVILIENYKKRIEDIAYLFVKLQNKRGILKSSPITEKMLLTENCEVAGGILSYLSICKRMGWVVNRAYIDLAVNLPKKIISEFYNPAKNDFYWKIREETTYEPDWKIQHPDVYSQFFPFNYNILNTDDIIGLLLWEKINTNWAHDNKIPEYKLLQTRIKLKEKAIDINIKRDLHPVLEIEKNNDLTKNGKRFHFIPYKTTLKAISQLSEGNENNKIKNYITWYLEKTNTLDLNGNSGTIYQQIISPFKNDQSLFKEDKTVLSSSLFLILISDYAKTTSDTSFFSKYASKIEDMLYLIHHLQDKDGLIRSDTSSDKKSIIDNILALYALKLFIKSNYFKGGIKVSEYKNLAEILSFEIKRRFFSKDDNYFYKEISENSKTLPNPKIMYPDMFSQIFPFTFEIEDINSEKYMTIGYFINSKLTDLRKSVPGEWQFIIKKFTAILNKKGK